MNRFFRLFTSDPGEPVTLDHLPVTGAPDWRDEKLKEAARRHGKAFECAGDGLPRKIRKDGADVVVGVASVTHISARKA